MNLTRFTFLSGFAMVIILVLFFTTGIVLPDNPPWNAGHGIVWCLSAIVMWPLLLGALFLRDAPFQPSWVTGVWVVGSWALSGLFWGLMMELFFANQDRRSNQAGERTGSAPRSSADLAVGGDEQLIKRLRLLWRVLLALVIGYVGWTYLFGLRFSLERHVIPVYPSELASLREIIHHYKQELAKQGKHVEIRVLDETDIDKWRDVRSIEGDAGSWLLTISTVFETRVRCSQQRVITFEGIGTRDRYHDPLWKPLR